MSRIYRSDDATALVGMPELVVGAQLFRDGEWRLNVETPATIVWCHGCGCQPSVVAAACSGPEAEFEGGADVRVSCPEHQELLPRY